MINLKNDYNSIGAQKVIENIIKYQSELNVGYGEDLHTAHVRDMVRQMTNMNVDTYILTGGTQTNLVGLSFMLKNSFEAVIAVETGHINVHETGAVEGTGHKVITIKANNGKATVNALVEELKKYKDNHMVKPKALYISNSTEIGTIYTKAELKALYETCKENNLFLFLDGARLGVALEAKGNDLTMEDIAKHTDMFYIGGTKIGSPIGECLVITNDDLKQDFKYHIKNKGALLAKGFFAAICFEALLSNNYFLELAKHANMLADKLREELPDFIIYPNPTNQVFIKVTKKQLEVLQESFLFEIWEEQSSYTVIRIVTTYQTTEENIKKFIKIINMALN